VGKGLKRVVKKEFRQAARELTDHASAEDSVHEARKNVKKIRAAVQLLGSKMDTGRTEKHLRRAGRLLSPVRDADAVIETTGRLCSDGRRRLSRHTCATLAAALKKKKARVTDSAERGDMERHVLQSLERARRSILPLDWGSLRFADFVSELRREYKRARKAMGKARKTRRDDDFHTWRKQIKAVWYALRLLEKRVAVGRQLAGLERLETLLGDDHNLVVLRAQIAAADRRTQEEVAASGVEELAERQQQALRRRALIAGKQLFRGAPKQFEKRLRRMWSAA
jgi:hypothetical protein